MFAIGTCQTANAYLLDLLSYGNRGDATIVESGRWDIPAVMESKMREVSRPVLSDVGCRFSGDAGIEVYPVQSSNLYLDRGLVLYGRYPVTAANLVFQAVGQAGDVRCDMIFQVNLREARKSDDKAIRLNWASQKIYNLISRYARQRDPAVLDEMVETSDGYRVRIPYRRGF